MAFVQELVGGIAVVEAQVPADAVAGDVAGVAVDVPRLLGNVRVFPLGLTRPVDVVYDTA